MHEFGIDPKYFNLWKKIIMPNDERFFETPDDPKEIGRMTVEQWLKRRQIRPFTLEDAKERS